MTNLSTGRYAYETACMIPAVQTVIAGWCAIGNGLVVASKVPNLAKTYFQKANTTFAQDMQVLSKRREPTEFLAYEASKRSMGASLTALSESVQRAIPFWGTYSAGSYLSKELNLSLAETLSLMPVVNVLVGGATVASNVAKIGAKYLNVAARKAQVGACHTYHYLSNIGNKSAVLNARFNKAIVTSNKVQAKIQRSVSKNADAIGHGIVRAMPGATWGAHLRSTTTSSTSFA